MVEQLQTHAELEDLTVECDALTPQDLTNDVDDLARALHGLAIWHAVPALDDLWPGRSETEDRAPSGQRIECRHRLTDQRR